jgi:hypothetical protein
MVEKQVHQHGLPSAHVAVDIEAPGNGLFDVAPEQPKQAARFAAWRPIVAKGLVKPLECVDRPLLVPVTLEDALNMQVPVGV